MLQVGNRGPNHVHQRVPITLQHVHDRRQRVHISSPLVESKRPQSGS